MRIVDWSSDVCSSYHNGQKAGLDAARAFRGRFSELRLTDLGVLDDSGQRPVGFDQGGELGEQTVHARVARAGIRVCDKQFDGHLVLPVVSQWRERYLWLAHLALAQDRHGVVRDAPGHGGDTLYRGEGAEGMAGQK